MPTPLTEIERTRAVKAFWDRVEKTPTCWLWRGAKRSANGYGYMIVGSRTDGTRRQIPAHVLSWEIHNGHSSLKVLHKCDKPLCVRPDHLFVGTQGDNVRDMMAKGRNRQPRGSDHWHSAITQADADAIRERYAAGGVSQSKLARDFGIGQPAVWKIVHGRTWKK